MGVKPTEAADDPLHLNALQQGLDDFCAGFHQGLRQLWGYLQQCFGCVEPAPGDSTSPVTASASRPTGTGGNVASKKPDNPELYGRICRGLKLDPTKTTPKILIETLRSKVETLVLQPLGLSLQNHTIQKILDGGKQKVTDTLQREYEADPRHTTLHDLLTQPTKTPGVQGQFQALYPQIAPLLVSLTGLEVEQAPISQVLSVAEERIGSFMRVSRLNPETAGVDDVLKRLKPWLGMLHQWQGWRQSVFNVFGRNKAA